MLYVFVAAGLFLLVGWSTLLGPVTYTVVNPPDHPRIYRFVRCAMCLGTWCGLAQALAIGWALDRPFLGLAGRSVLAVLCAGACTLVTTPILGGLAMWGLEQFATQAAQAARQQACTTYTRLAQADALDPPRGR